MLGNLAERLHDVANARVVEVGSQLSIRYGEVELDLAFGTDGRGRALEPSSVVAAYCALKPLLAARVVQLLDEPALHTALSSVLPHVPAPLGELTPAALLSHTAGLAQPFGAEYRLTIPERRLDLLATRAQLNELPPSAYSECSAWHLLGLLIETLDSRGVGAQLRSEILTFTHAEEMWLCEPGAHGGVDHVATGARLHQRHGWRPLLAETTADEMDAWNPGFGGYSSMRALANLYHYGFRGADLEVRMRRTVRAGTHDPVLGRACSFGLGVMVGLSSHQFGNAPDESAYGHSGYQGQTFAFRDPAKDLTVAFTSLGGADVDFGVGIRRPQLIDSIYAEIETI